MESKSQYFIYGLVDPIKIEIKYVGKTTDVKIRLDAHCSKLMNHNKEMLKWIDSLKIKGLKPYIIIFDITKNPITANYMEKYYINKFGENLFNKMYNNHITHK